MQDLARKSCPLSRAAVFGYILKQYSGIYKVFHLQGSASLE